MIHRHHLQPALFKPLTVLPGDLEVAADDAHGGNAAETDDDFRVQQLHLAAQVIDARILLHAERIAVFGRTALDDIGNIDVIAPEPDDLEHVVKQLTCSSDKGNALRVLVGAGTLADEQHLRAAIAHTENDVGARFPKRALAAVLTVMHQSFPAIGHKASSCVIFYSFTEYHDSRFFATRPAHFFAQAGKTGEKAD